MLRRPFGRTMWNWRETDRLRREMDRLFADWPTRSTWSVTPSYPAMNVWTSEDGAVVQSELPGIDPDKIDISVANDTLTVSGERQRPEMEEEATYHRRERGYGRFTRTFTLPFQVEADQVEANYEKGILYIRLPRAEADKPKKITIQGG
jgi:HSP20 family protein